LNENELLEELGVGESFPNEKALPCFPPKSMVVSDDGAPKLNILESAAFNDVFALSACWLLIVKSNMLEEGSFSSSSLADG